MRLLSWSMKYATRYSMHCLRWAALFAALQTCLFSMLDLICQTQKKIALTLDRQATTSYPQEVVVLGGASER